MFHREHGEEEGTETRWHSNVTAAVVDAGLKVHRALGPGLLESAYEHCLAHELSTRGRLVERQVPLPIVFGAVELDAAYRMDMVVEGAVIVEVKAVDLLTRLHEAQLLTYLKLSGRKVGLLLNFNVVLFKDGIRRLAM